MLLLVALLATACGDSGPRRPNVLLVLSDDQSWLHAGCYGDAGIATPHLDRLAREGVRFSQAYAPSPSCVPSRSAILTGQDAYRLGAGALFGGTLPREHAVYPLLLERAGYHVGWTGKGWGPGDLGRGGWGRDEWPQGRAYQARTIPRAERELDVFAFDYAANFADFLDARADDEPFAFWCGLTEPHKPYAKGAWKAAGKRLDDARLPGHLPDVPVVRAEVLDYGMEVEYADAVLGELLAELERRGLLDDTLVVFTSDNGIALPRAKGTLYDAGTRMPLVARWGRAPGGRVVDDFVNLTDLAPTFLEAAGVAAPEPMTGRSLVTLLESGVPGRFDPARDFVVTSLERHGLARPGALGYPMRALRTARYLYVRNLAPERWAAGDPDFDSGRGRRGYLEVADTPTKTWMLDHRDDPDVAPLFRLAFGKRPPEELYDCEADPAQVVDVAGDPDHAKALAELRGRLDDYLDATLDPRAPGAAPGAAERAFEGIPYALKDSRHWTFGTDAPLR